jgi:hypothetical protein
MMWPLLSNGLSEVGQLSAVSVRGPTRSMVPVERVNHPWPGRWVLARLPCKYSNRVRSVYVRGD